MNRKLILESLEDRRLLATGVFAEWAQHVLANDTQAATGEVLAELAGTVSEQQLITPHRNLIWDVDVNRDGALSPSDALAVINQINNQELSLPAIPVGLPMMSVDVNGDNQLSPIDALIVVNAINGGATSPISSLIAKGTSFGDELYEEVAYERDESCEGYYVQLNANSYVAGTFDGSLDAAKLHTVALRQQVELRDGENSVWGTRHITRSSLVLAGWGMADFNIILKGGAFDLWETDCEYPSTDTETLIANFVGHVSVRGEYEIRIMVETSYDILGTPGDSFEGYVTGLLNTAQAAATIDISIQADYMHVGGTLLADALNSSIFSGKNSFNYSQNIVDTFDASGSVPLKMSMESVRVRSLMIPIDGVWYQEQYRFSTFTVDSRPETLTGTATVEVLYRGEISGPSAADLALMALHEPLSAFVRGPTDLEALQAHDEVLEKRLWTYERLFDGL